ncbi:M6 family metalloprotease domain-containing protein [Compostimonas suwonensis]|uniref:M6 family metalloprotease-like protein n=1 Tax=Compostimonas suwonensis TaxID=1048394 RepID=A0A2M9BZ35_9MICO|nr:M6 family metalloprotease domain-containing protein [Compostimonas suwonensis]PJJ63330.1 M6 family metalloprotease-like protein [Compostimonas suwonensis]
MAAPADPADAIDPSVLNPVDPQNWENMDDMTWDDYTAVPNTDWANETEGSERPFHGAIVLVDFPNQPFLVTQDEGSHPFKNPSGLAHNIPRDDVPEFYLNLLNEPNELNHGHTINEYWMEQTGGRLSVQMQAFGPYEMPSNIEQYGLNDSFNKPNAAFCPQGETCNKDIRTDAKALWAEDIGVANPLAEFDEVFYITAGHDESSTWEEFGQMLFENPEDVTADFGPPAGTLDQNGQPMANWAKTRYIPWTSWAAAINHWPNANFPSNGNAGNSTQAESSGMGTFAHEFSHILGISDNYGNPYGTEAADGGPLRDTSGPFDILARGSFNGPGGTHKRWGVPSVAGGSQPAGVALRNRINLDLIDPYIRDTATGEATGNLISLTEENLKAQGSIVTNLTSRAVMLPGKPTGINIAFERSRDANGNVLVDSRGRPLSGDNSNGSCTRAAQWDCDGGNFDNYTLEVIDRMGTDSFQPDHGVMISKTKNADGNPFIWTIDANPQDINTVDYVRPDGTPIMITRGDQRQLNDALFHAGNNSGSEYEYVDEANGMQFYVVNMKRDDDGLLSYDVAVRSLTSPGPQVRGVSLGEATATGTTDDDIAQCTVPLTNTGGAVTEPMANNDIFRITTSVNDQNWTASTPSSVVTAATGETIQVPVYIERGETSAPEATLTVTATSENDPTKTQSVDCVFSAAVVPTDDPTDTPTEEPTDTPTDVPTDTPTEEPTDAPTTVPADNNAGTGTGNLASTGVGAELPIALVGGLALLVLGGIFAAVTIQRRKRRAVIE